MSAADSTLARLQRSLADRSCAGPASQEMVDAAEQELGVQFPASFRLFLLHFGAGCLPAPYDLYGLPPQPATDDAPPMWFHIVGAYRQVRRHVAHPDGFVPIASDGCGVTIFLDTDRMNSHHDCPVVARGPGVDDVIVARSFPEFVETALTGDPLAGL